MRSGMPAQDPSVRNQNFEEVALGYTKKMAIDEAQRCLNCKNPACMKGCPVMVHIPEPDASGRRRPIEVPNSEFNIDVDCVIMALGTSPNPLIKSTTEGLEINRKGGIVVNEDGLTSKEMVYAGGDAVTGAATVILAMGAGKTAAKAIDEVLSK